MRSRLAVTLLAFALASTPARVQEPAPASPQPTLLSVDAVAVDRKGNPVTDLRPGDVELWLEQYRIPLESMTVLTKDDDRRRRTIVLLLDDITLAPELMPRAREAGRHLVTALEPEDRMAVVTLTGASIKATDDRAALRRAVDSYGPRATEPLRPDDLAAKVLNMLTAIARQAAELPGHRRTVIAIGPGWVFDTPIPPSTVARDLRDEWTTAMRSMALANVTLYVIDPSGVGGAPSMSGAIGMARETGGHAFLNTNDVTGAVDRIMRDAVSYYILRFEDPPFFRTAPLRKLDVRVKRRDVTVRARQLIPGTPAAKR
jgi:VWFA-related protein